MLRQFYALPPQHFDSSDAFAVWCKGRADSHAWDAGLELERDTVRWDRVVLDRRLAVCITYRAHPVTPVGRHR
jgi:hypothetical protein